MVAGFRAWTAQADTMADKYSAAPSPIDFATAKKSIRDKALVDGLEQFAKSFTPPAETYEWSEDDKASKLQLIEDAKAGGGLYEGDDRGYREGNRVHAHSPHYSGSVDERHERDLP